MVRTILLCGPVAFVLAVACDSGPTTVIPDVASDTTPDSASDVRIDADALTDVGEPDADAAVEDTDPDAPMDSATDSEPDSLKDAPPDAIPDAEADVGDALDPDADASDVDAGVSEDTRPDPDVGCPDGFEPSEEGCIDIDEYLASPCGENATCANREGDFDCTCDDGFIGDGLTCEASRCLTDHEPARFTRRNEVPTEDCITENVCLARENNGPLFNSVAEEEPHRSRCGSRSPIGVEFSAGACLGNAGPFETLKRANACGSMAEIGGDTFCMHLIEDDLWFDLEWHSFTGGGPGGGFSYTRTLVGGDPCGVDAICEDDEEGVSCSCPDGTSGEPESFCL